MAKHEKAGFGDLSEAAQALERELHRFEELSAAARKVPLDTHKGIERAAKATTEAASGQERVDATLRALVAAIGVARERHEANANALQARGEEIRLRAEEFEALYARYRAFGEEGRSINQLVQEAANKQGKTTTPEGIREVVAVIEGIEERMAKLVDNARELGQAAIAAAITDLAAQADALRQQVGSARNKLGLLKKSLVALLPDPSKLN